MIESNEFHIKRDNLLHICEKYSSLLNIPYFTVINNIYEPFVNNNMNSINRAYIQELYERGIFDSEYRQFILDLASVDKSFKKWIVPIVYSDFASDNNVENFDEIYKIFDSRNSGEMELSKVYNAKNSIDESEYYVISSHKSGDETKKYVGRIIEIKKKTINSLERYVMEDNWVTLPKEKISDVNTFFANNYISTYLKDKKIPQTKFNLGEDFLINRLIDDFKTIINDDNFDMNSLRVDELLDVLKNEINYKK